MTWWIALISAQATDLPATGQQDCYADENAVDDGESVACAGTGQDGEVQAGVHWPESRFELTYCDADGPCADQSADCDASGTNDVITDHLTGLMWLRDQSASESLAWLDAITFTEAATVCGYADWHTPTVTEARSLASYGPDSEAWLEAQGFVNLRQTWTSTTAASSTYRAFAVDPGWGFTHPDTKIGTLSVWPVRVAEEGCSEPLQTGQTVCFSDMGDVIDCAGTGQDGELRSGEAWPSPRFVDNDDGSVTDLATSLVWLSDVDCLNTHFPAEYPQGAVLSWGAALDAVAAMNAGDLPGCGDGFSDWRLPNVVELQSVMSYDAIQPSLPAGHPFENGPVEPTYNYWTSTSHGFASDLPNHPHAWYLHLYDGSVYNSPKSYTGAEVWPVRGGILDGGDCGSTATEPDIAVDPLTWHFGTHAPGTTTSFRFIVSNEGTEALVLGEVDGPGRPFTLISQACSETTLEPGEDCELDVSFHPVVEGDWAETIGIPSNDPDQPLLELQVLGEGGQPGPSTGCGSGTCRTGPGSASLGLAWGLAVLLGVRRAPRPRG